MNQRISRTGPVVLASILVEFVLWAVMLTILFFVLHQVPAFRFERPKVLWAMCAGPVVLFLFLLDLRRRWRALQRFAGTAMLPRMVPGVVFGNSFLRYLFFRLGLLFLVIALAGPQFGTRIEVDTQDEFGEVAQGFNRMATTLQSLYQGLEAKVAEKTQHIEAQRTRLEALYEVSAFLAQANTIEELSRGFAQRVRAVMHADAVAVRWSDEANQRYLMLASDCFPQEMQDDERSLMAGACACGILAANASTRVIPIHQHEQAPLRRCARAGYEHLITVPVRLQQRVIGEVDLFYRGDVQISPEETELLDALASHLASALEGLRAEALEREAAVGQERSLLARELHDSIAQSLAFLKIQLQLLRTAIERGQPEKIREALDELDEGLKGSIGDVRELLVHFRTRTNTGDIETALQETLQKFQHQSGVPVRLQMQGEGLPLPADVQVQVLHVVQEALSNVRKHAQATHVSLDVTQGERWTFVVRDNGVGFDPGQAMDETHVGSKIMRERAERIGATVEVRSEPGHGTAVTLSLPPYPVTTSGVGTMGIETPEHPTALP